MAGDEGEITLWIGQMQSGGNSGEAARKLWGWYFRDLVRLARARFRNAPRGPADEEDAALGAFEIFCRGVTTGRFRCLAGRDELWRLLVILTIREVMNLVRRERRLKRGGGRVAGETPTGHPDLEGDDALTHLSGDTPSPELAAMAAEDTRRLFGALGDETLRLVALMKLEGYTNEQIATGLACGLRSVERMLDRIRKAWRRELGSQAHRRDDPR
jgi:DNA-directed RNA polymerase specialized sigma24 family protein